MYDDCNVLVIEHAILPCCSCTCVHVYRTYMYGSVLHDVVLSPEPTSMPVTGLGGIEVIC